MRFYWLTLFLAGLFVGEGCAQALPPTVNVTLLFQGPANDTLSSTSTLNIWPDKPFSITASDGSAWFIPQIKSTVNVTEYQGEQMIDIIPNLTGATGGTTYTADPETFYHFEYIGTSGTGSFRGKIQVPCCDDADWGSLVVPMSTQ